MQNGKRGQHLNLSTTVGVRMGDIEPTGAYFSTQGSSTYFDPADASRHCYDLSQVKICVWDDPTVMLKLFKDTLALCTEANSTPRGVGLLRERIAEIEEGDDPYVHYFEADETPMAQVAKSMGFDGILVFENDDWTDPSSVFVWAVDKVSKLTAEQRAAFLKLIDAGGAEDTLNETPARPARQMP